MAVAKDGANVNAKTEAVSKNNAHVKADTTAVGEGIRFLYLKLNDK